MVSASAFPVQPVGWWCARVLSESHIATSMLLSVALRCRRWHHVGGSCWHRAVVHTMACGGCRASHRGQRWHGARRHDGRPPAWHCRNRRRVDQCGRRVHVGACHQLARVERTLGPCLCSATGGSDRGGRSGHRRRKLPLGHAKRRVAQLRRCVMDFSYKHGTLGCSLWGQFGRHA